MNDFQINKKKVACLYHADADGFGAAFAVWKHLKDTCELLFIKVQYGQMAPLEELRAFAPNEVYIVDFSYKTGILNALATEFEKVTVIDHHKSAELDLRLARGIDFKFDSDFSGAVLTWAAFSDDPDSIPDILLYVQDRDLWKFELENSKEINAFIATMDESFEAWDDFYMPEAYDSGKAILKFQANQIKRRLKDVRLMEFEESKQLVPVVNASDNISELGEAMCLAYPDAPFSVSYCNRADGKRSYSLRSRNEFDVSAVASAFGGGGHRGAAGFTLDAPDIICPKQK